MTVCMYELSAAELAQVEGGFSFSWGEVNSPDYLVRLRRVVS
jgi:hypothetical protein